MPSHGGSRRFESCCAHQSFQQLSVASTGWLLLRFVANPRTVILLCALRRHEVDGADHLLLAFRYLLHILIGRPVCLRVPQVPYSVRTHSSEPQAEGSRSTIAWSFPTQSCLGNQLAHPESSSTLASVTRLVQYCVNTCSAVDAAQRTIPLLQAHGRQSAATDF
jgi:hypothetical protein